MSGGSAVQNWGLGFSLYFLSSENFSMADMTSIDSHASPVGLEVCLRCKKGVKGTDAGLECDLCHYWFHTTQNVRV